MEEDDDGEGSSVRGNEEVELEVELQKKNVRFIFMCVGACYKVEEGMDLFFSFFFGGWELRLWLVMVMVAMVVNDGGNGCWQWVCW